MSAATLKIRARRSNAGFTCPRSLDKLNSLFFPPKNEGLCFVLAIFRCRKAALRFRWLPGPILKPLGAAAVFRRFAASDEYEDPLVNANIFWTVFILSEFEAASCFLSHDAVKFRL